jgi:hypothetical protein
LERREAENKRLGGAVERERNWDKLQAETLATQQGAVLTKLEAQLDFLNKERVQLLQVFNKHLCPLLVMRSLIWLHACNRS